MLSYIWYIALIVFAIWCILDVAKGVHARNTKFLWMAIIIFLPLVGGIAYLLLGRKS